MCHIPCLCWRFLKHVQTLTIAAGVAMCSYIMMLHVQVLQYMLLFMVFCAESRSAISDDGCVPSIPGMAFVIRVPEKEQLHRLETGWEFLSGNVWHKICLQDKWLKCDDGKDCVAFFRDPPKKPAGAWKGGWQDQAGWCRDEFCMSIQRWIRKEKELEMSCG